MSDACVQLFSVSHPKIIVFHFIIIIIGIPPFEPGSSVKKGKVAQATILFPAVYSVTFHQNHYLHSSLKDDIKGDAKQTCQLA